ncbi:VOC family protein [Fodinibius sp.]|uniref:VOC family protein n=1 Tax=Fodinibius sp. TaxID=1872440 RepID=UPI002ACE5EC6|nr:VOC family protein [Fodinibius sp.]MDZ7659831.1 VOC family protein [Fodinibius sp.]
MPDLSFDHYTIKVADLKTSASFYSDVLGLNEIKNRTEKPHIRWFSLGNGCELHVVEGPTEQIQTNVGVHLALKLSDIDAFIDQLKSHGVTPHNSKGKPESITTRADGIRQVYFPDPDGYWIEVNEACIL